MGSLLGFCVVSITRAGACVAGGPASPLPDWPASDGPAASFPSSGVEAVSLALEGGGGSSLGMGGGSSLGIRGRSGLFAGGWPLVKANRAEISLSAWWGSSWERPFRARATRACARTAFGAAGAGVPGTGASEADAGTSAGGARLGGCVISIPRSGAHAAGGPTSMPPDEPAPDGPAASFPSAGVEAVSLALEGGGGSALGGGGSTLGIRGRSGLFAGGWPLVKVNRAEISLSAWWGRSWERPFRACPCIAVSNTGRSRGWREGGCFLWQICGSELSLLPLPAVPTPCLARPHEQDKPAHHHRKPPLTS